MGRAIRRKIQVVVLALAGALSGSAPANAIFIGNSQGGTEFPQGAASFADAVTAYEPAVIGGEPTEANRNASRSVGVPDYVSGGGCVDADACTFVSLGDGGRITLRFTDNLLTGSDDPSPDLWVFEVGPDIEDTFVEVSSDGVAWFPVGKVFGSTAGVDLDAFGFGASAGFSYVRLTDDGEEGDQTGISVGADIDAVGAITTIVIPEPGSLVLVGAGTALLGGLRRRKRVTP